MSRPPINLWGGLQQRTGSSSPAGARIGNDHLLSKAKDLLSGREFAEAVRLLEESGESQKPSVFRLQALAVALAEVRQVERALDVLFEARELAPGSVDVWANLLSLGLNSPRFSGFDRADFHKRFGGMLANVAPIRRRPVERAGRLRLGYLSSNFRLDPEMFFRAPILRNHDRDRFEVFAYSTVVKPDGATEEFSRSVEHFRPVAAKGDREIAELVVEDRIDVLVDMVGHFSGGRLPVFAYRPAPVQVSYPLYPATTGLLQMDYRIADPVTDPMDWAPGHYTEALVHLECGIICYDPPAAPALSPLPADLNGFVTFGVFARPAKITDDFLGRCAEILSLVPDSRLLFHHAFNGMKPVSEALRGPIEAVFERMGVDPRRLEFEGAQPLLEHLEIVSRVDIALDTYPYNGMTITCECLWMGVPVITLAGDCHVGRVGASLLTRAGLPEWIATSPREFVAIAVRMASIPQGIRTIREGLRESMRGSYLTNGAAYTRTLEAAYEMMWERERKNQQPDGELGARG